VRREEPVVIIITVITILIISRGTRVAVEMKNDLFTLMANRNHDKNQQKQSDKENNGWMEEDEEGRKEISVLRVVFCVNEKFLSPLSLKMS
jgi:hypothetical protein